MSGVNSHMGIPWNATYLPIRIETKEAKYYIDWNEFDWGVQDSKLRDWSAETLRAFNDLRVDISAEVRLAGIEGRPLVDGLTLSEAACIAYLKQLAKPGFSTYWGFFDNQEARQALIDRFADMMPYVPTPTFVSSALLFPWEALYEGDDYDSAAVENLADKFWGFRYAPARVLDRQPLSKVKPQDATPNMLFCLHRSLRQAHEREWPAIQRLVAAVCAGQIHLLSPSYPPISLSNGRQLLNYLKSGEHNMIHFACHAVQDSAGEDVLQITPIDPAELGAMAAQPAGPDGFGLATDDFIGPTAKFQNIKPLVMLNACQTVDSSDELRVYYNLPQAFIDSGAAAVIATACPVPDVFAAEFARVFYEYFLAGADPLAGHLADATTRPPTMGEVELMRVLRVGSEAAAATGPLTIGEALRRTRGYFLLKHHNPLGLAYGLYSPAHYQVARPPDTGGAIA